MANNWIGDYEDLESTDPVEMALTIATRWGGIDGDNHKAWVIDQMVRALTGERYEAFVAEAKDGPDGPDSWSWNEGICP